MRNLLSWLFYIPGGVLVGSAMLYSVFLSFKIVFSVFPAWAAYLSFIFFPIILFIELNVMDALSLKYSPTTTESFL